MNERPAKRARLEDGRGHTFGDTNINSKAPVHMGDNIYISHEPANDEETLIKSLLFDRIDTRMHSVKRALSNTCEWLFKHTDFKKWEAAYELHEHNGFLWIKGKPGCGKSTLMKHALDRTRRRASKQKTKLSLLQYFFNARAPSSLEKSSLGMYRSITHQLLSVPTLRSLFVEKFGLRGSDEWTAAELQDFLCDIVEMEEPLNLCMFIDALDEGEYQDDVRQMIGFLVDLSERAMESNCQLRICLSSRHYPYISIKKGLELVVEKQIEHAHDIDVYIHQKLLGSEGINKNELIAEMCRKSANVFLWVVLVVDMLNKIDDQGALLADMKQCLDTIPSDLNQLFTEILTKSKHGIEASIALLQWVLFALRSLRPEELYAAIQYSRSPWSSEWVASSSETTVPSSDRVAKYLLDCSRGLVEVTATTPPTVQFIHETVREFLKGDTGLASLMPVLSNNLKGLSHEILKIGCSRCVVSSKTPKEMAFMRSHVFRSPILAEEKEKLYARMPFVDYAISYVYGHAEAAEGCGLPQASFLKTAADHQGRWCNQERLLWNLFQKYHIQKHEENVSLLYFLADQSHSFLLSTLLSVSTITIDNRCGRYGTALLVACVRGDQHSVLSLIMNGANINALGGQYKNVFAAAIASRNFDLVSLLEKHGALMNQDVFTHCFKTVIDRSDKEGLKFMVKFGAETGLDTPAPTAAFRRTAIKRKSNIGLIRQLLELGANVNAQDGHHGNALQAAAYHGNRSLVQLLLEWGANVNAQAGQFGNALQAAAASGEVRVVQLLLDHGADVNAQGGHYGNALGAATAMNRKEVEQLLISYGARS